MLLTNSQWPRQGHLCERSRGQPGCQEGMSFLQAECSSGNGSGLFPCAGTVTPEFLRQEADLSSSSRVPLPGHHKLLEQPRYCPCLSRLTFAGEPPPRRIRSKDQELEKLYDRGSSWKRVSPWNLVSTARSGQAHWRLQDISGSWRAVSDHGSWYRLRVESGVPGPSRGRQTALG